MVVAVDVGFGVMGAFGERFPGIYTLFESMGMIKTFGEQFDIVVAFCERFPGTGRRFGSMCMLVALGERFGMICGFGKRIPGTGREVGLIGMVGTVGDRFGMMGAVGKRFPGISVQFESMVIMEAQIVVSGMMMAFGKSVGVMMAFWMLMGEDGRLEMVMGLMGIVSESMEAAEELQGGDNDDTWRRRIVEVVKAIGRNHTKHP